MSPPWRNGRRQTAALLRGHVAPLEMGRASFCLAGMVAGRGCGALCAALPPQARPWEPILGEREALRPHSAQVSIQLRRFSSHPATASASTTPCGARWTGQAARAPAVARASSDGRATAAWGPSTYQ